MSSHTEASNRPDDASMPIAIVGLGFRGPGDATNVEKLWKMIIQGREAWSRIPETKWNNEAFYHPDNSRHGTINVQGGHFLTEDVSLFDAPFFNMTSDEAAAMDPQQRLLLEVAYEGIENAGISLPSIMGSKTSCFVGSFCTDYTDLLLRDPDSVPMYQCTNAGQSRAMTANRISYFFDLKGPSVTVDTACSGSLVALHLACQSLRTGDASTAIAAGVNVVLSHEFMSTMSMMKFLSPDGRCYTFDDQANGYARGEAIGCLILKPLHDALRDGDTIRAIIRGSGSNQDGRTPGITLPSGASQEALIRHVYNAAGLDPRDTEFVEAHGTGTQAGDPIETGALAKVFGPGRPDETPLRIGSIKTNVGHLEGSSGVAGVIKAVLMLENRVFLPNRNFTTLNPRILLDEWKLKIQLDCEAWDSPGPHRVSVNSFGYGGSNAHIILEDAAGYLSQRELKGIYRQAESLPPLTNGDPSPTLNGNGHPEEYHTRVYTISGFDEASCNKQAQLLSEYLQGKSSVNNGFMNDLAYTLNTRRTKLGWKTAVIGGSAESVAAALSGPLKLKRTAKKPSIGFVFTGQGAQWCGMGRELFDAYPVFRQSIDRIDDHLARIGAPYCLVDELLKNEDPSRLSHPLHSQPICSAIQIALIDLLSSWGITPDSVTGHSSGEIASAYAVGALSMEDAMTVAYYRGVTASKLPAQNPIQGAMMALGMSAEDVQPYIDRLYSGKVVVACINSPSTVTISGDLPAIEELEYVLSDKQVFSRRLAVEVAYHSHHMELIGDEYLASIANIQPIIDQASKATFFSSVTGREMQASDLGPEYWVSNLLGQVKFVDAVNTLCFETNGQSSGTKRSKRTGTARKVSVDCLVEVGPHSALSGSIKQILKADSKLDAANITYAGVLTRKMNAVSTALTMAATLATAGYPVNFDTLNSPAEDQQAQLLVDLPPYAWNHSRSYWAEPRLSKVYRNRKHPRTDLLGVPDNMSCPFEPRWRNIIRVAEIPWLQDHKIQSNIVYPAAGYIAMAIEAASQHVLESSVGDGISGYRLRDVSIQSALVVHETSAAEVMVSLRTREDSDLNESDKVYEFHVYSVTADNRWTEHCKGVVAVQYTPSNDNKERLIDQHISSLSPLDIEPFYEKLTNVGLEYGPSFANMTAAHFAKNLCLAEITIPDTASVMPMNFQYPFVIHPCTLDSFFHTIFASLSATMDISDGPPIPVFIDEIYISRNVNSTPGEILDVQTRTGKGSGGDIIASIEVADRINVDQVAVSISGLKCRRLAGDAATDKDKQIERLTYSFKWEADPDLLSREDICRILSVEGETGLERAALYLNMLGHKNPKMTILEIGAGSGSATAVFLQHLTGEGNVLRCAQYTVTDPDDSVLEDATQRLKQWDEWVDTKKLDIESEVDIQEFKGKKFDLVIASHGLSMIKPKNGALSNIRSLVKDDGHLLVIDPVNPEDLADRVIFGSFSQLTGEAEGEWESNLQNAQFSSEVIQSSGGSTLIVAHPLREPIPTSMGALIITEESDSGVSIPRLKDLLTQQSLTVETSDLAHENPAGRLCIVLSDLQTPLLANPSEETMERLKQIFMKSAGVLWVTRGGTISPTNPDAGLAVGFARTARSESGVDPIVTLDLDGKNSLDSQRAAEMIGNLVQHRFILHRSADVDVEFAEREGIVLVPRIVENTALNRTLANGDQNILHDEPFHQERSLRAAVDENESAIHFVDDDQLTDIPDGHVGIEVQAVGLMRQDAQIVAGDSPSELGGQCSGIIYAVGKGVEDLSPGDRVACMGSGTMASRYHSPASSVQKLPENMSFELGGVISVPYCTAFYAFNHLARVSPDDRVLINDATASAGQALIEMCTAARCQVFATVPSEEAKTALSSSFNIQDDQIFVGDMRDFHETDVDVVFNCHQLDNRLLQKLWKHIRPYGRFVQLGSYDASRAAELNLPRPTKDILFTTLDFAKLQADRPDIVEKTWFQVIELFRQDKLHGPSTYTSYSISDINEAVKVLNSKDIAPIVVTATSNDLVKTTRPKQSDQPLRSDASYMLVGGLGGIGRATALWMADNGAKTLIFINRSGLSKPDAQVTVQALQEKGVHVVVKACDVSNASDVKDAVSELSETLPPIRGVIQAAMILQDIHIEKMTAESYNTVLQPKYTGTWNLHNHLPQTMDFFLLLSSISGVIGNATQSAYAAGSTFMDTFAAYRNTIGLPALALDLGVITDVGYLAENKELASKMAQQGFMGTDTPTLLELIKMGISQQVRGGDGEGVTSQIVTGLGEWKEGQSLSSLDAALFAQFRRQFLSNATGGVQEDTDTLREDLAASKTLDDAAGVVYTALSAKIAAHLSVPVDNINPASPISEYGVDSHVAVELRNWISKKMDSTVPILEILASGSVMELASKIASKSLLVRVEE